MLQAFDSLKYQRWHMSDCEYLRLDYTPILPQFATHLVLLYHLIGQDQECDELRMPTKLLHVGGVQSPNNELPLAEDLFEQEYLRN